MKVVILCGGLGTRLAEETTLRPKPMVTVGGHPMLWHIMSGYARHGYKSFMLTLGYMGSVIKEHFLHYHALSSDLRVDLATGQHEYLRKPKVDWTVELIETGAKTMTGGRLDRLKPYLATGGTFMLTYGDGVSNVDVKSLVAFHKSHGKIATVTAVRPTARFGAMGFEGEHRVRSFREKQQTDEGWINGGFFVFEPKIFDYLEGDETVLEGKPMERLAADGQLMGYRHDGFWQCMDTVRDRQMLEELWASGRAPWRTWE